GGPAWTRLPAATVAHLTPGVKRLMACRAAGRVAVRDWEAPAKGNARRGVCEADARGFDGPQQPRFQDEGPGPARRGHATRLGKPPSTAAIALVRTGRARSSRRRGRPAPSRRACRPGPSGDITLLLACPERRADGRTVRSRASHLRRGSWRRSTKAP